MKTQSSKIAELMLGHTRSRLPRWTALLALVIALVAAPVMAQETGTVKISGRFSMDYLSGELDLYYFEPDLLGVYYNGHEHTWTLTLHGTTHSHYSNGSYYGTDVHSTSFDLEFFGPDAATLNGIVSKHLAGRSVNVYLENTYYSYGGGFAIMHVGVGGGGHRAIVLLHRPGHGILDALPGRRGRLSRRETGTVLHRARYHRVERVRNVFGHRL